MMEDFLLTGQVQGVIERTGHHEHFSLADADGVKAAEITRSTSQRGLKSVGGLIEASRTRVAGHSSRKALST